MRGIVRAVSLINLARIQSVWLAYFVENGGLKPPELLGCPNSCSYQRNHDTCLVALTLATFLDNYSLASQKPDISLECLRDARERPGGNSRLLNPGLSPPGLSRRMCPYGHQPFQQLSTKRVMLPSGLVWELGTRTKCSDRHSKTPRMSTKRFVYRSTTSFSFSLPRSMSTLSMSEKLS